MHNPGHGSAATPSICDTKTGILLQPKAIYDEIEVVEQTMLRVFTYGYDYRVKEKTEV